MSVRINLTDTFSYRCADAAIGLRKERGKWRFGLYFQQNDFGAPVYEGSLEEVVHFVESDGMSIPGHVIEQAQGLEVLAAIDL